MCCQSETSTDADTFVGSRDVLEEKEKAEQWNDIEMIDSEKEKETQRTQEEGEQNNAEDSEAPRERTKKQLVAAYSPNAMSDQVLASNSAAPLAFLLTDSESLLALTPMCPSPSFGLLPSSVAAAAGAATPQSLQTMQC